MFTALLSRKFTVVRLAILISVLAVFVSISPSEKILGASVRIVYVHGSMMQAGELLVVLSGILGVAYLFRKSKTAIRWSTALQRVGFVFLLVSFAVSLYAANRIWGNIDLGEPRLVALLRIVVPGAAGIAITFLFPRPKVIAWNAIIMVATTVINIAAAALIMHPDNPIGLSPSAAIKGYYGLIVVLMSLLGYEAARLILLGAGHKGASI